MVTTLSKKEKKVSHTTIHTFTTSIQNLFSRLQQKFRPSDVLIFLQILKPLAILPVEYQGELGPLQKVLCQIYEQVSCHTIISNSPTQSHPRQNTWICEISAALIHFFKPAPLLMED